MPKRIVKHFVMVQRDGVLKYPTVGKEFDFTAEELEAFNKQTPCPVAKVVVKDESKVAAPVAVKKPPVVVDKPA